MPDIYYQHYTPVSAAIPDICAQEHALGRRLLLLGLSGLYGIHLSENELNQELKAAKTASPGSPPFPASILISATVTDWQCAPSTILLWGLMWKCPDIFRKSSLKSPGSGRKAPSGKRGQHTGSPTGMVFPLLDPERSLRKANRNRSGCPSY